MDNAKPVILVIDDEAYIRRSFRDYLEDLDYTVLEAENGCQGLDTFAQAAPDLVLVDLRMPEVDGLEVLAQIVAQSPDTPVVVISGTGVIADAIQALRVGAWDYLLKPMDDMGLLSHTVCKVLEKAELIRQSGDHQKRLEHEVWKRTEELQEANSRLVQEIHERIQAEQKVVEHQNQLRALVSQLTLSEEKERKRLAVDLHDGICQSLAMAKLKVDERLIHPSTAEIQEFLGDMQAVLVDIIDDTRSLTNNLGVPMLQKMGLNAAIEKWLATEISEKHQLETQVTGDSIPLALDDDTKALLFRAVRELAMNVVKHAQARTLTVTLNTQGHEVLLSGADDGKGFQQDHEDDPRQHREGYGLFSIRERIDYIGGKVDIESVLGQGTKVVLYVPLKLTVGQT